MNTQTQTSTMPQVMVNGVNVTMLNEAIEAIKNDPMLAESKFRARNHWIGGTHCRNMMQDYCTVGEEHTRTKSFMIDADEPPALMGEDRGANPVEIALAALASCVTTSLIVNAAARGITLHSVESKLEGDLNLQGFLNIDESYRNGYENIRMTFKIKADAPEETIRELVEIAQQRSPVFDIVTNPTPATVTLETE